jgi:hypothetical protein
MNDVSETPPPPPGGGAGLWARARRRPRIMLAAAILAVAAGVLAAVLSLVLPSGPPKGLVVSLDLPKGNACGKKLVAFRRLPEIDRWAFPLDRTWHHTRPCLRDMLAAAEKQPPDAPIHAFLEDQVLFILSQKPVRFYHHGDGTQKSLRDVLTPDRDLDFGAFDRVVYVNRRDVAHNAMSHVGLMQSLFEAARIYAVGPHPDPERAAAYQALGQAVVAVALDPVAELGLRTRLPCDLRDGLACSWFHAVTNRNRDASDVGGTLNKNLQVIRDLNRGAIVMAGIQAAAPTPERAALIAELEAATAEGINQLVYSSGLAGPNHTPSLFDYLPRNAGGVPIPKAWLYYAINVPKAKGYYLRREYWKNCSYHVLDMNHLHFILKEGGHLTDTSGFREPAAMLGGKSILHFILDTYLDKLEGPDGLYKDTPTEPDGEYMGCKEGFKPPAPQFVVDFFRDY